MNKNIQEFDLLRIISALAVIGIHVTSGYLKDSTLGYIVNQGTRFAVPLFILLSGYLLAYSEINRRPIPFFVFIQKRFKKLLIPYIVWTIIYLVYRFLYGGQPIVSVVFLNSFKKNIQYGTAAVHLYFILIMLQLYLFFPVFKWMLKTKAKLTLFIMFIITFVGQTIIYLHGLNIITLPPHRYVSLSPLWFFYFIFGMYLANKQAAWTELVLKNKGKVVGVWIISLLTLISDSILTNTYDFSIKPSVVLYCLTSFFFFYLLSTHLTSHLNMHSKLIKWFSDQTFFIYLSHLLVIKLIKLASSSIGISQFWSGDIGMILLFTSALIICLLLAYVINFLPFAPWLGGVYRKKLIKLRREHSVNLG